MNRVKDKRLWLSIVGITGLGLLSGLFSVNARILSSVEITKFCSARLVIWTSVVGVVYFMGITFYFILVHPNKQQKNG